MSSPQDIFKIFKSNSKSAGAGGGLVFLGASIAYGLYNSIYTVQPGHASVMFNRIGGVQDDVFKEGVHLRMPWFQTPVLYNIRSRPSKISSLTGSKDLQIVNISLRVLARPNVTKLPKLYQLLGLNWEERVLPSICNEILKSVVAKFNASQLITQRTHVSNMIKKELGEKALEFMILVDDVAVTELTFGKDYTRAVEEKQIAQQEVQRAQFIVEKALQEKQQKIVKAEGESTAAKMIGEALENNPSYIKLRKITAAQNIAKAISQSQNKAYLDANNLMLNIGNST